LRLSLGENDALSVVNGCIGENRRGEETRRNMRRLGVEENSCGREFTAHSAKKNKSHALKKMDTKMLL
jgi:hypothetical protein